MQDKGLQLRVRSIHGRGGDAVTDERESRESKTPRPITAEVIRVRSCNLRRKLENWREKRKNEENVEIPQVRHKLVASPFLPLPPPLHSESGIVLLLLFGIWDLPFYRLLFIVIRLSFESPPFHLLCPSITMPYNTRRKSLSLPSLGIHLPNSSRRSPSISKGPATEDLPPAKKVKRSHTSLSPEPSTDKAAVRAGRHGAWEHTPPPSPLDGGIAPKIDTDGIHDDIVVAVIDQLEKTGNRPHLVKELAAVLVALNANVAKYVVCSLIYYQCRAFANHPD